MAFGLEKPEIESIFIGAIEEGRNFQIRGLGRKEASLIARAISEVIAQNNELVIKALTKAGVKI